MTGDPVRRNALSGWLLAATLGVMLGVPGCSEFDDYAPPSFPFGKSYASARNSGAPVLLSNTAWWTSLKDPALNALIDKALAGNLDLATARERVVAAEAAVAQVPDSAELVPQASVLRTDDDTRAPGTEKDASLGLSWLLDPYGSRKRRIEAARARLDAADAEVDAARLLVIRSLANAYLDLRFNQAALTLRQRQLASRREAVNLTQRLFDQRSATRLDIVRTSALVAETQSQIPPLKAAIRQQEYRIAVLTGALPGTPGLDLGQGGIPRPLIPPDVGIPPDLLRNRPDIRIAERLYYAAVAEIGVARAELYPQLSLGGTISAGSLNGASTSSYAFGPSLVLPSLFLADTKAGVTAAESRARLAYDDWRSTVLEAVLEVETALEDYAGNSEAVAAAERSARLQREAVMLTRDLILSEGATALDLVDAEQSAAAADIAHLAQQRDLVRSYIDLNVSLGSGHGFGGDSRKPTSG